MTHNILICHHIAGRFFEHIVHVLKSSFIHVCSCTVIKYDVLFTRFIYLRTIIIKAAGIRYTQR